MTITISTMDGVFVIVRWFKNCKLEWVQCLLRDRLVTPDVNKKILHSGDKLARQI